MPNSLNIIRNPSGSNQDITAGVQRGSVQLNQKLTKDVGTLQFNIEVTVATTSMIPALNDEIAFWVNGVGSGLKYFGGTVTNLETTIVGGILQQVAVTCTDWNFLLNKTIVAKNYAQMDPHDIIVDLITTYAPAGFTTSNVQKGNFLVPSIKFNYEQLFNCMQKLATLIGWQVTVDPNKNVQFFVDGYLTAPFNVDDTSGNQEWTTIDWQQDLTNMKNSVYVIGGNYKKVFADPAVPPASYTPVDKYTSVAGTLVYPLAYPYDISTMVVKLAGVSQTIGKANQSGTFQVYYSDVGRYIQFASDPGTGSTIEVTGTASVPIVAYASNPLAIAQYGAINESIVDKSITTNQEAFMRAQAEILQYGAAINDIKFSTLTPGLMIGQRITFNSAQFLNLFGLSALNLTIKTLTATDYSPSQLEYQVECIGSDVVTFNDILSVLLQQENQNNPIDSSTVTETIVPVAESMALSDSITVTGTSAPYSWGLGAGPQLRGGFSRSD